MDSYLLWTETPYLVLDTETTGFGSSDRICEITLATYFRGECTAKFSSLIDPGVPVSEQSTAVHGITEADLRGAPRLTDVAPQVLAMLFTDVPWVAHNMSFDLKMLARDIPVDRWPRGIPTLCTMTYARKASSTRGLNRHRVQDLASHFGVQFGALHRSDADVEVLAKILPKLVGSASVQSTTTRLSEDWF